MDNLCTPYLRACDSRLPQPVLGDHAAPEAVERIDYDFARLRRAVRPWSNRFLVALRAKQLDVWAADFLQRHPDAVVLHLGCGLDSRALWLERPSDVQWFDVDVPQVIDLRRSSNGAPATAMSSPGGTGGWSSSRRLPSWMLRRSPLSRSGCRIGCSARSPRSGIMTGCIGSRFNAVGLAQRPRRTDGLITDQAPQ